MLKKIRPLFVFHPKMSRYRRDFDKTKCMSFLIKDENCQKNIIKFGKNSATLSKENLTVNLYTMKNIY